MAQEEGQQNKECDHHRAVGEHHAFQKVSYLRGFLSWEITDVYCCESKDDETHQEDGQDMKQEPLFVLILAPVVSQQSGHSGTDRIRVHCRLKQTDERNDSKTSDTDNDDR